MATKKLQEMNLLDDFLFGKLITYPELGEKFCKRLISVILGVELTRIKIVPQKVYYGADVDLHGARLDIYIEEDGTDLNGTLFDFEPDKNSKPELKKALPQRARFYHALLDQECLKSGQDYGTLKRVVVILVMPYDPFGCDHMIYTIKNHCEELPDMPYDDGAKTLFLYTKGKKGVPSKMLQELMHYMEESTEENACNEVLKEIHGMVTKVKHDRRVSIEYMKIFEREKMIYDDGREKGYGEGFENGREEGFENGREKGLEEGVFALIADNLEFGVSIDQINVKLQRIFALNKNKAQEYIDSYLTASPSLGATK